MPGWRVPKTRAPSLLLPRWPAPCPPRLRSHPRGPALRTRERRSRPHEAATAPKQQILPGGQAQREAGGGFGRSRWPYACGVGGRGGREPRPRRARAWQGCATDGGGLSGVPPPCGDGVPGLFRCVPGRLPPQERYGCLLVYNLVIMQCGFFGLSAEYFEAHQQLVPRNPFA